jgi:hypothetical protein
LKTNNPAVNIMVRESNAVEPKIVARHGTFPPLVPALL